MSYIVATNVAALQLLQLKNKLQGKAVTHSENLNGGLF